MIKKIKNSGFTLIELLVVIAIIGVLASIVLVSLGGARAKSSATKAKADIAQIMNAFELLASDSADYSTVDNVDVAGTTCAVGGTEFTADASNAAGADLCYGNPIKDGSNTYITSLPRPSTNYVYELESAYTATSYGFQADGFTNAAAALWICKNGSCYCSTNVASDCEK